MIRFIDIFDEDMKDNRVSVRLYEASFGHNVGRIPGRMGWDSRNYVMWSSRLNFATHKSFVKGTPVGQWNWYR